LSKKRLMYGELWRMPLEDLYDLVVGLKTEDSWSVAGKFSWYHWPASPGVAIRLMSGPLMRKGLTRIKGREGYRLRAAASLDLFIRQIDHQIDPGDLSPRREESAWECFLHATGFAIALDEPSEIWDEPALPEMTALLYAFRVCWEQLDMEPRRQWQNIWECYTPDALRTIRGEVFAASAILSLAQVAYNQCIALILEILGAPREAAVEISRLTAPLHYADVYYDLLSDIEDGCVQVPVEDLELAGIDLEAFLAARSYDDLASIPGAAHWYAVAAQNQYERWLRNRKEAIRLVDENIESTVGRLATRYMIRKLAKILRKEAMRFGPIPAALRHEEVGADGRE
jgi:hypothetical protein